MIALGFVASTSDAPARKHLATIHLTANALLGGPQAGFAPCSCLAEKTSHQPWRHATARESSAEKVAEVCESDLHGIDLLRSCKAVEVADTSLCAPEAEAAAEMSPGHHPRTASARRLFGRHSQMRAQERLLVACTVLAGRDSVMARESSAEAAEKRTHHGTSQAEVKEPVKPQAMALDTQAAEKRLCSLAEKMVRRSWSASHFSRAGEMVRHSLSVNYFSRAGTHALIPSNVRARVELTDWPLERLFSKATEAPWPVLASVGWSVPFAHGDSQSALVQSSCSSTA